jgi:hypothetical protein
VIARRSPIRQLALNRSYLYAYPPAAARAMRRAVKLAVVDDEKFGRRRCWWCAEPSLAAVDMAFLSALGRILGM